MSPYSIEDSEAFYEISKEYLKNQQDPSMLSRSTNVILWIMIGVIFRVGGAIVHAIYSTKENQNGN